MNPKEWAAEIEQKAIENDEGSNGENYRYLDESACEDIVKKAMRQAFQEGAMFAAKRHRQMLDNPMVELPYPTTPYDPPPSFESSVPYAGSLKDMITPGVRLAMQAVHEEIMNHRSRYACPVHAPWMCDPREKGCTEYGTKEATK